MTHDRDTEKKHGSLTSRMTRDQDTEKTQNIIPVSDILKWFVVLLQEWLVIKTEKNKNIIHVSNIFCMIYYYNISVIFIFRGICFQLRPLFYHQMCKMIFFR